MSMTTGRSDIKSKRYSSSYCRKNDPGELEVFEAAQYYSGHNGTGSSSLSGPSHPLQTRRMSLDEHVKQPSMFLSQGLGKHISNECNSVNNGHKHQQRQPRSPGGKITSFLNSLFNQSNSRKKKKKSNKYSSDGGSSMLQASGKEHEDPNQRRWRRTSISHFRSLSSATDSYLKSTTNSISSIYCRAGNNNNKNSSVTTPTKSHKELRSSSDHRQVEVSNKPVASTDDKMKMGSGLASQKMRLEYNFSDNERGSGVEFYRKFSKDKDDSSSKVCDSVDRAGDESDSSSDLFELQISGEGCSCLSDLPVYETTHIERLRLGAPPTSHSAPSYISD